MRIALAAIVALSLAACVDARPPASGQDKAAPPPPPPELTSTHWVLSGPPADEAPTVDFGFQNRASGFTGCNQWFANYDQSDGLRFQSVGTTRRACPEPIMDAERSFLDAIAATTAVTLDDGGTLSLRDARGAALLTLQPRA